MDRIEQIIQLQKDFQSIIKAPITEIGYSNQCFLALIRETTEALEHTQWKHKSYKYGWKNADTYDWHKLVAELADVFIFYINILNVHHIDYNTICDEVVKKIEINNKRQEMNY